jgi:hypothetical protein
MDPSFDTTVRLRLYGEFVESGRAPSAGRLAEVLESPVGEVRAALERLASGKAIVLQPESRELMIAAPLSAIPTPFLVHAGPRRFFGACAWDALGVMAMLGRDTALETSCPCCGEAMALDARGGELLPAAGIVHFGVPARQWWDNIVFS